MIKQKYIKRESRRYDEGEFGFHDWVTEFEKFDNFVQRVSDEANNLEGYVLNIQYIHSYNKDCKTAEDNVSGAVIIYRV